MTAPYIVVKVFRGNTEDTYRLYPDDNSLRVFLEKFYGWRVLGGGATGRLEKLLVSTKLYQLDNGILVGWEYITEVRDGQNNSKFPHACPNCGKPSYNGFTNVECSSNFNSCKYGVK